MQLSELRQLVIASIFADEVLYKHVVLKGGNALELVHHIISRGSTDIDLSISDQFDDPSEIERRIFQTLRLKLAAHGLSLFDESFRIVPPIQGLDPIPWWGGYVVEFKIIESTKYDLLQAKHGDLQRQSIPIDLRQGRIFRIDISKHEHCREKVTAELAGQTIYVYSEEMCVFEKYRSICQQMPEYQQLLGKRGHPRGRDFYDIYMAITKRAIDISLPENLELCRAIFEVKHVPIKLISQIEESQEFHRPDWDAVRQAIAGEVFEFDYYFDFVVNEATKLEPLWME